jgi:hypothetical protein
MSVIVVIAAVGVVGVGSLEDKTGRRHHRDGY